MAAERWQQLAEVLLGEVELLLDERDDLRRRLAATSADLDVAEARIRELEGLRNALEVELLRTKTKPSKARVGAIAAVIALVVPNVVSGVSEGLASQYASRVHEKATDVAAECNVTLTVPAELENSTVAPSSVGAAGAVNDPTPRTESRVAADAVGATDSVNARVHGSQAIERDTANPGSARRTFEKRFEDSDWRPGADPAFVIFIPPSEHGAGETPSVTVQGRRSDGSFEDVGVEVRTLPDGTVRLGASITFAGRALIQ